MTTEGQGRINNAERMLRQANRLLNELGEIGRGETSTSEEGGAEDSRNPSPMDDSSRDLRECTQGREEGQRRNSAGGSRTTTPDGESAAAEGGQSSTQGQGQNSRERPASRPRRE